MLKKTDEMVGWMGPGALADVRPTGAHLLDFLCSGIQLYLLLRLDLTYFIVYKQRDWIQVITTLENPLLKTCTNSIIVQRIG